MPSPALELAARSSLEAIAFGMTVDDLYSFIGIPGIGRGQRLEDSLASRLSEDVRKLTMGDWGDRALEGTVPIVIFNSTDAISGRRILFDTIPTPLRSSSVGLTARPLNYRELMESGQRHFDVSPATAARCCANRLARVHRLSAASQIRHQHKFQWCMNQPVQATGRFGAACFLRRV